MVGAFALSRFAIEWSCDHAAAIGIPRSGRIACARWPDNRRALADSRAALQDPRRAGELRPPVRIKTSATSTDSVKALILNGKTPLIVTNVDFDDGYDRWKEAEGSEAIHINGSTHVWLHQNRSARFRAVAVEMDDPISDYVTMTYNLFENSFQAVVINARMADFHHNRCLNTGARCPKVNAPDVGEANLYVYNNLIEFWKSDTVHHIEDPGQYLAEHNVYNPRADALRQSGSCGGTSDAWCESNNFVVGFADEGGCLESRWPHVEHGAATVTFRSYCSASLLRPVSVNFEWASDALAASLRNNARPQAYSVDNSCK